ncbi:hypothetical protein Hanom_Chr05g00407781 [Helianthus anomalus]
MILTHASLFPHLLKCRPLAKVRRLGFFSRQKVMNPKRCALTKARHFNPKFLYFKKADHAFDIAFKFQIAKVFQTNTCFVVLVVFLQNTTSWFSNYLFDEYSDKSIVPDSYEGTTISDSYEKPFPSNMREEEVVSAIRYCDNTMQLDLNIPVDDAYAQHNYSNYGYGGDPYP